MQSSKNSIMGETFDSSNNVCGFCIVYLTMQVAHWLTGGVFVGFGICIILSGKTFKTKSRKGTLLITKFVSKLF